MGGTSRVFDKMKFFDDSGQSIEDYLWGRVQAANLEIVSPTQDGRNSELAMVEELAKAALTTADTGAINAVYDMAVFMAYATKKNTVGALRHVPWARQGFRIVKTASVASGIGIAEGGALGTAVEPTYLEIGPTPKEVEVVADYSTRLKVLAKLADGVAVDQNRRVVEKDFWRSLEADLNGNYNTLAGNNIESIHRVTGTTTETTQQSYTAGDEDMFSIDVSTETAYMGSYLGATGGTDRDLVVSLINDMEETVMPYWESQENKFFLTGLDTWMRWSEFESAKTRYSMEAYTITIGDGIKAGPGIQMGGKIATWDGMPVVTTDAIDKTGDTISPIYLIDNETLAIYWGLPVSYQESDNPFQVGHLVRGLWYGIGELVPTSRKTHCRLRDLK